MSNVQAVFINQISLDSVSGYALINDIHSNPMFILQISQNKAAAYQQGIFVRDIFLGFTLLLSVCFGVGFTLLLEREIVKPMTQLAAYIEELPLNPHAPVPKNLVHKSQELFILSNAMNGAMKKKLEGMDEVSRIVGHDLRNPLTGIKGAAYILKKNYGAKLDDRGNAQVKIIDDCVEYSDKIVRDLLEYSCEIKLDKSRSTSKRLVNDSLSTLVAPRNVNVINEVSDEFTLLVDNGQIQRVFSNVIKNAFDAMPAGEFCI
jgi:signal transduction histidine kinase